MAGTKQETSTDTLVLDRIDQRGPGWVFTPADFADLGTSQAVRHALMRGARAGRIRHLARGLYDLPRQHPKLGLLSPSPDAVAKALQSRDASRLQPTGAYAANLLGLSEQVPARIIFHTDGRARTVQIGKQQIVLRKRSSRAMAAAGRPSGLVIAALENLGREAIDEGVIAQLRRTLKPDTLRALAADARYAPAWIAEILRQLSVVEEVASHE
jgi:hypothetical protein